MHPGGHQSPKTSLKQAFGYPFRVFFLSTSVLAALAIPLWVFMLSSAAAPSPAIPALFWHQHEMLFGLLTAAIAGFLLTAVCVWTGTERLNGGPLLALWLVWLAGRVSFFLGDLLPQSAIIAINLAFIPLVMLDAGRRVVRTRQWRQAPILAVLLFLWMMQIAFLLSFAPVFTQAALLLAMALITIIGGRITPNFSRGWLRQRGQDPQRVKNTPRLDLWSLTSLLAVVAAVLIGWSPLTGVLALIAGGISAARLWHWRGWLFRGDPLLWILHLSIAWIPVGLFLMAGAKLLEWPMDAWVHALALGAMSSLILGVMARVALGHTGRALVLPKGMVIGFFLIQAAAVLRVGMGLQWLPWHNTLHLSALLWELAFVLFLALYTKILLAPRADGKPG